MLNLQTKKLRFSWIKHTTIWLLQRFLGKVNAGNLTIILPDGQSLLFEGKHSGVNAMITLKNYAIISRLLKNGSLGFAEGYLRAEWDTPSLDNIFRFFLANEKQFLRKWRYLLGSGILDKAYHYKKRNTQKGSQNNIAAHYDLGNDFFQPWLDEGMTYSSALFTEGNDQTLEEAQDHKYQTILDALRLKEGESVLEIGCGWGGFAEAAFKRDPSHYVGLTLSHEQLDYAKARFSHKPEGITADFKLQDYRNATGQFDKIVSIEMIEAVGEKYWPNYFDVLKQRTTQNGVAVIQAITIAPELFENYRKNPDFIQRYIFPGGMLPTIEILEDHATKAGFDFETVECFGQSYAKTLEIWRSKFETSWPKLQKLGFDERFYKMWHYYLSYCIIGFKQQTTDVGIYKLTKRDQNKG